MEVKEREELEDKGGFPIEEKKNNEKETGEKDVMAEVIRVAEEVVLDISTLVER